MVILSAAAIRMHSLILPDPCQHCYAVVNVMFIIVTLSSIISSSSQIFFVVVLSCHETLNPKA